MPIGRGKSPENELTEHIAAGTPHNNSGTGIARDLDDDTLVYNDPMQFPGVGAQVFDSALDGTINAENLNDAAGLFSAGGLGQEFGIEDFNTNNDHGPSTGPNAGKYGPQNVGK